MNTEHFLLGIDANVVIGAGTLITSIAVNNPNLNLVFHIFAETNELLRIKPLLDSRIAAINKGNIELIYKDITKCSIYEDTKHKFTEIMKQANRNLTIAATYRLIALEDFKDVDFTKLTYLDSDILCNGPIDDIVNIDFSKHDEKFVIAAIKDNPKQQIKSSSLKGFSGAGYINSGVLVVNIPLWNKLDISQKTIDYLLTEKPAQIDQDALNVVTSGKVLFLSGKYNAITNQTKIFDSDDILIHFTGAEKPWKPWISTDPEFYANVNMCRIDKEKWEMVTVPKGKRNMVEGVNLYRKYLKQFEPNEKLWWSYDEPKLGDNILWYPSAIHDYKMIGKLYKAKGKYGKWISFVIKHFRAKIKRMGLINVILSK